MMHPQRHPHHKVHFHSATTPSTLQSRNVSQSCCHLLGPDSELTENLTVEHSVWLGVFEWRDGAFLLGRVRGIDFESPAGVI